MFQVAEDVHISPIVKLGKWSPGFVFGVAIAGWPAVTRAESIWLPLTHTATASSQVSLSAAYHQGIVPRFRLSERDVRQISVEGVTRLHEQILFYMHLPATPSALGELTLGTRADLVTGLRSRTTLGAPPWGDLMAKFAREHAPDKPHVFFCGPQGLAHKVRQAAGEKGLPFRQEHF